MNPKVVNIFPSTYSMPKPIVSLLFSTCPFNKRKAKSHLWGSILPWVFNLLGFNFSFPAPTLTISSYYLPFMTVLNHHFIIHSSISSNPIIFPQRLSSHSSNLQPYLFVIGLQPRIPIKGIKAQIDSVFISFF